MTIHTAQAVLTDQQVFAIAAQELTHMTNSGDPVDFDTWRQRTLARIGDGAAPGRVLRVLKSFL